MEATENTAIKDSPFKAGSFVPDDVLSGFDVGFLDEGHCRVWVMWILHRDEAHCPKCSAEISSKILQSFWRGKRIKCDCCGKYFTALTGTFLSGSHFNFREIVLLGFLLALGVADKQIATILKISAENVRLWRHRFEAIAQIKQISSGE